MSATTSIGAAAKIGEIIARHPAGDDTITLTRSEAETIERALCDAHSAVQIAAGRRLASHMQKIRGYEQNIIHAWAIIKAVLAKR